MDIEIRPATTGEAVVLTALAHDAKRCWGYSDELMDLWRNELTFTPEYVDDHPVFVAEVDKQVAGVYALAPDGDGYELGHLWVRPDFHGAALGRQLLDHAVAQARTMGLSHFMIVSDPYAEGFYLRMGATRMSDVPSVPEGRRLPVLRMDIGIEAR